jgi:predicted Zn-dependent peptidase
MRRVFILVMLLVAPLCRAADITLPAFERVVLDNGTVLLLNEKRDVPIIGMNAIVRGGSTTDPAEQAGLSSLLASMLQKGAGARDAAAFAEAAARVGGRISSGADLESFEVSAEFLSRDVELMIDLVSDMLLRPMLAEPEFDKLRQRRIALIRAAKDGNPSALTSSYGNAFLFGDHPYGSPTTGSESSLAAVDHDALVQHYARFFGGDRLIIAVSGDFDVAAMRARLTQVFGGWQAAAAELPAIEAPARQSGRRVLLIDKPGAAQTYFWIGNVGVAIDYSRRAELRIANTLFGGRFTSMLMTALRVESGLTYGASSVVQQYSKPGSVTIQSFAEASNTIEAIDMATGLLDRLHRQGVNDEMIASARNYIMGQFPPTLETASSLASMVAWLELHGLDRSYIDDYGEALDAVTPVSVHNAISEVYPGADDLVFVLIGDAAKIRDAVSKYGPVTELSITEPRFRAYQ